MKTLVLLLALLLSMPLTSLAGWETMGNVERLAASDTTIKQYVVSDDGKSLFVLDTNSVLRKFDASTGNKIWEKDLKVITNNYSGPFTVSLSENGDRYVTATFNPDSLLSIQIRNIETDSIEISQIIIKSRLKTQRIDEFCNLFDLNLTNDVLYLFEGAHLFSYFNGGNFIIDDIGTIRVYRLVNDSLQFIRKIPDQYMIYTSLHRKSNILLGYFYDNVNESDVSNHTERFYFSQNLISYDPDQDAINYLYEKSGFGLEEIHPQDLVVKNISLSPSGSFGIAQLNGSIIVYDTHSRQIVNSMPYAVNLSSIAVSNDDKLMLLAHMNSVWVHSAMQLGQDSMIIFPELKESINDLSFSPDGKKVYFSSGKNIYRFIPDFKLPELKAFFYTDLKNTYARNPVSFTNASSGYPDSCLWDFGDGNFSTEKNPVHAYIDTGYFDVKLTVYRGSEKDSFIIREAEYIRSYMLADFDYVIDDSQDPVSVEFINKSQGDIDRVYWDFGDGNVSNEFNTVHYYHNGGTYRVNLRIHSQELYMDTSRLIKFTMPITPIDKTRYKYEYIYSSDSSSEALQAYESTDGSIIFNKLKDSATSSLVTFDRFNGILGENNFHSKDYRFTLAKSRLNNNLLYNNNQNRTIFLANENGAIINSFNIYRQVNDLGFNVNSIYASSNIVRDDNYTSGTGCMNFYYLSEFDNKLNPVSQALMDSNRITDGLPIADDYYKFNIMRTGGLTDFLTSFGYTHPATQWSEERNYSAFWINGKLFFQSTKRYETYDSSSARYRKALRLNKDLLVILQQDSFFSFYHTGFHLNNIKNVGFNDILKLNDTAFVAAGSINDHPGYVIYNDKGQVLDSASIPSRIGRFNHISVTPDTNLLFSGYIYKDFHQTRQAYFVKTGTGSIKTLINALVLPVDTIVINPPDTNKAVSAMGLIIIPNPAKSDIKIPDKVFSPGHLIIDLTDIYGGLAGTLYDNDYTGGELTFDLSQLADGIYFLKTSLNGETRVSKVVKIR